MQKKNKNKLKDKKKSSIWEWWERDKGELKGAYSDDFTVAPRDLVAAGEEVSDGFEEASDLSVHFGFVWHTLFLSQQLQY